MSVVPGENPALDAQTQWPLLVGVAVAFVVGAAIVVSLRIFTRVVVVKGLGSDDIVMVFALVREMSPRGRRDIVRSCSRLAHL